MINKDIQHEVSTVVNNVNNTRSATLKKKNLIAS